MRNLTVTCCVLIAIAVGVGPAQAYTFTNLGAAGGWDDINKSATTTALVDQSDFTLDLPSASVAASLSNAFTTWDNVETAPNLNFAFLADDGGNYDVFDGPNDSNGPPWFDGTSGTLDQNAHWRYANIVVGGFLPEAYFGSPNILAVTWTGKLTGDGSRKPGWHSEVFFNDAWNWTDDAAAANADLALGLPNRIIDLETVALHELGHTIGLDHEDDVPSVMATFYGGAQRDLLLDDVAGVTALYSNALKGGGGKGGGGKGGGGGGKGGGKKPKKLLGEDTEWSLTGVTRVGDDFFSPVPEPSTLALALLAVASVAFGFKPRRANRS